MSTVKSAINSLCNNIETKKIFKIKPVKMKNRLIKLSLKKEFLPKIVRDFTNIKISKFKFHRKDYIHPYILPKKDYYN